VARTRRVRTAARGRTCPDTTGVRRAYRRTRRRWSFGRATARRRRLAVITARNRGHGRTMVAAGRVSVTRDLRHVRAVIRRRRSRRGGARPRVSVAGVMILGRVVVVGRGQRDPNMARGVGESVLCLGRKAASRRGGGTHAERQESEYRQSFDGQDAAEHGHSLHASLLLV